MARKSKGRQKIEMTKMSKESNLLVTFSKRRSGLFKKASELCTLCGVEIAIIVFSPGKKVFSFGHPCVESILDRFLGSSSSSNNIMNTAQNSSTLQLVEAHRNAAVRELNIHLTELMNQLEVEKNRGEEFTKMSHVRKEMCWWEAPINELGIEDLEQLKMAMEGLKRNVDKQAEKITMEASSFFPAAAAGSSSSRGLGHGGGSSVDVMMKATSGMGLSMTPYGYALGGYGRTGFF